MLISVAFSPLGQKVANGHFAKSNIFDHVCERGTNKLTTDFKAKVAARVAHTEHPLRLPEGETVTLTPIF